MRERGRKSCTYDKHYDQYWKQEICAKRAGRKRWAEEAESHIGTEDSTEHSQACDTNQAITNKRQK